MTRARDFATLVLWGALALAGGASAATRTLFVGIDHYRYTTIEGHDADFHDLKGAVADVALVKAALARRFGLVMDAPGTGPCPGPGPSTTSLTLIDACATRARILGGLKALIASSAPGDTVLFFYAGHGAQSAHDAVGDQPGGRNSTIVQSDARLDLNDPNSADILDTELGAIIDAASVKGVNIVTIFDSCNSGTATRALTPGALTRAAPPMPAGAKRPAVAKSPGRGRGYVVHLAAAADGVTAHEKVQADGVTHGVFSYALATALENLGVKNGTAITYADVFAEATRIVKDQGYGAQQPQSEGNLYATFLGRDAISTRMAPVRRAAGGGLALDVGALSGVTIGSTYGLFATSSAAAGDAPATISASVSRVDAFSAGIVPTAPPPDGALWARETSHRFAANTVRMRVDATGTARAQILAALAPLDLVQVLDADPQFVLRADAAGVRLFSAGGDELDGTPLDPAAGGFAGALGDKVRVVARYQAVLALRESSAGEHPTLSILSKDNAPASCDRPAATPNAELTQGDRFVIALTNTAAAPRFLYLFSLQEDFSVVALVPKTRLANDAVAPGCSVLVPDARAKRAGRYQLLLLSTTNKVDSGALAQTGVSRDAAPGASALERLLRGAEAGSRAVGDPPVVDWGAATTTVTIKP